MTTLGLAIREPERIVVEALTLIAASDLLHAAVIPVNRDRPTSMVSVAAFVRSHHSAGNGAHANLGGQCQ